MAEVTRQIDIDAAVTQYVFTLADERLDLLERIAAEMAKDKGATSPPKLSVAE